jgi:valine--pyruvate aminotransferase
MSNLTGVRAIMKDIQATLSASKGQEFINLSAGNPVILPAIEQMWRDYTYELLDSPDYGEVVCRYGSSQGYQPLIDAVVSDFNHRYGLNLTAKNVLITPGSQSLYFYAMNAFGGQTAGGQNKQVVLPLSPDYTGYGGMAIERIIVSNIVPILVSYRLGKILGACYFLALAIRRVMS